MNLQLTRLSPTFGLLALSVLAAAFAGCGDHGPARKPARPAATATDTTAAPATKPAPAPEPYVPPLRIEAAPLPVGIQAQAFAATLQAANGTPPYRWRLAKGNLPPGLALDEAGRIAGSPTATGLFEFTVEVADGAAPPKTASAPFAIFLPALGDPATLKIPMPAGVDDELASRELKRLGKQIARLNDDLDREIKKWLRDPETAIRNLEEMDLDVRASEPPIDDPSIRDSEDAPKRAPAADRAVLKEYAAKVKERNRRLAQTYRTDRKLGLRYLALLEAQEKRVTAAAAEAERGAAAAGIANPLKAVVGVQKRKPAEWSLRITNLSGQPWTNVVVELVTTAHGAGYVRDLRTVDANPDVPRVVDCFECQRDDGQRFNALHMNLRAIRIKCDQGEAEVPAVEDRTEEDARARFFREQMDPEERNR